MASTHRLAAASTRPSLLPRAKKPRYICLHCQLRALSTTRTPPFPSRTPKPATTTTTTTASTLSQSRQYATPQRPNDGFEGSFADKLRKKIWGTDNPPGQRNPYVKESPEEREERLLEEEEREMREREEADFERIRQGRSDEVDVREVDVVVGEQDVVDDVVEDGEVERGLGGGEREQERDYVPATTWRKLRHIPGWQVARLPPKPWFQGFLAPEKVEDKDEIERAIQRAIVEVWVMKQALGTTTLPTKIGNLTHDIQERLATGVVFDKDDTSLVFKDQTLEEEIMQSLRLSPDEEVDVEEEEEVFHHVPEDMIEGKRRGRRVPRQADVETTHSEPLMEGEVVEDPATGETEKVIAVAAPEEDAEDAKDIKEDKDEDDERSLPRADPSYRSVAFNEPDVKFAVLKRVMQLTGTRIADPTIPRLNSADDLRAHLIKPPPAKRLVEDLVNNIKLASLPNVELWENRYTEQDKEVEIGRWKLIEAELEKRGLPIEKLK